MYEVCIVFGSDSDAFVMEKIANSLKKYGVSFEARICSAHRTPKDLEQLVQENECKLFVAGAGLSSALPGVVASQTLKPVIGTPVSGNYFGLDSFLATHQLPPGIPVLGTGIDAGQEAARNAALILQKPKKIVVVNHAKNSEAEKRIQVCKETLEKFAVQYGISEKISNDTEKVFIHFTKFCKEPKENALVINVPISETASTENPLSLKQVEKGLWVGLGRGENAALAAIEILNVSNNQFEEKLLDYRIAQREKVLNADKEIAKKFS